MTETRVNDIYEVLKSRVTGFGIAPGSRLNEGALAKDLGVSRTPLREALNRLITEQLVEFRPGTGFFCRALDPEDIFHLYELRHVIETTAVRLAVLRASDADIAGFASETRATGLDIKGLTIAQAVARDEEFHIGIAALSGNPELVRTLGNINDRIRFIRWIRMDQRVAASKDEHRRILTALELRQDNRASGAMSDHIVLRKDQVLAAVKESLSSIYLGDAEALAARVVDPV